jgi:catechol 2,3-dioxygenase-like lactoylglutathione lyase family enzyme
LKATRKLDDVILLCEDIEQMKRFYHQNLGFPIYHDEGTDGDRWIEMQVGALLLTWRYRRPPYNGPDLPGSAKIQLAFRATPSEVDSCYAKLMSKLP